MIALVLGLCPLVFYLRDILTRINASNAEETTKINSDSRNLAHEPYELKNTRNTVQLQPNTTPSPRPPRHLPPHPHQLQTNLHLLTHNPLNNPTPSPRSQFKAPILRPIIKSSDKRTPINKTDADKNKGFDYNNTFHTPALLPIITSSDMQIPINETIVDTNKSNKSSLHHIKSNHTDLIRPAVPERIILMDGGSDLFHIDSPRLQNSIKTIQRYQNAFRTRQSVHLNSIFITRGISNTGTKNELLKSSEAQANLNLEGVWYLNNTECFDLINRVESRLAKYFLNEKLGKYKGDICRIVALYDKGGYYFDTDMEVYADNVVILPPHITFSTVNSLGGGNSFFQSFLAAAPKHPILRINMDLLIQHYRSIEMRGRKLIPDWMGPNSLYTSYMEFSKSSNEIKRKWPVDVSLEEIRGEEYPEVKRRGRDWLCNVLVHNRTSKTVYFYARVVGASDFCPY